EPIDERQVVAQNLAAQAGWNAWRAAVEVVRVEVFGLIRVAQTQGQLELVGQANAVVREQRPALRVLLEPVCLTRSGCVKRKDRLQLRGGVQEPTEITAELCAVAQSVVGVEALVGVEGTYQPADALRVSGETNLLAELGEFVAVAAVGLAIQDVRAREIGVLSVHGLPVTPSRHGGQRGPTENIQVPVDLERYAH